MAPSENGWNEYSRLVLEQLESLSVGIDSLRDELQDIKQEMTLMKAKEDRVQDLKTWKEKLDEVASPTQLKAAIDEIDDLKTFKTRAVTVFAGVQFLMAAMMAYSQMF